MCHQPHMPFADTQMYNVCHASFLQGIRGDIRHYTEHHAYFFSGKRFSVSGKMCYFAYEMNRKHKNIHNEMKNYIGIAAITLGALLLVISYITGSLVDYNSVQAIALLLIVAGIVAHIIVTKRPS